MRKGSFSRIMLCLFIISALSAGCGSERQVENRKNVLVNKTGNNSVDAASQGNAKKNGTTHAGDKKNSAGSEIKAKSLLAGRTICIDPGHQLKGNSGQEPIAPGSNIMKDKTTSGTSGVVTKIPEYELNLHISLLIKKKLEEHGARVIMTRETNNVNISNINRAKMANKSNAGLAVRIHADGAADSKIRGASVLYPGGKYIKDGDMLKKSKIAAKKVTESIRKNSAAVSVKSVERNDLTGFNWSEVPVILVEVGFMSNPAEDRLMKTKKYRENMAEAVVLGIVEYFKS
ncbi:MAG: N-acetylmuramoyl-L-alanine amidase [Clostridia bacterium]|nr:N-acetylmuramoyl-L-alanine amidase [Clostridia bacterium]